MAGLISLPVYRTKARGVRQWTRFISFARLLRHDPNFHRFSSNRINFN